MMEAGVARANPAYGRVSSASWPPLRHAPGALPYALLIEGVTIQGASVVHEKLKAGAASLSF